MPDRLLKTFGFYMKKMDDPPYIPLNINILVIFNFFFNFENYFNILYFVYIFNKDIYIYILLQILIYFDVCKVE